MLQTGPQLEEPPQSRETYVRTTVSHPDAFGHPAGSDLATLTPNF